MQVQIDSSLACPPGVYTKITGLLSGYVLIGGNPYPVTFTIV